MTDDVERARVENLRAIADTLRSGGWVKLHAGALPDIDAGIAALEALSTIPEPMEGAMDNKCAPCKGTGADLSYAATCDYCLGTGKAAPPNTEDGQ